MKENKCWNQTKYKVNLTNFFCKLNFDSITTIKQNQLNWFYIILFSVYCYYLVEWFCQIASLEKSHIFCKRNVSKTLQTLNAFWVPFIMGMLSQWLGCNFDSAQISSLFSQSWSWSKFSSQYSISSPQQSFVKNKSRTKTLQGYV